MANLFGSICISDIPKHLITRAKNGKEHLNIDIRERKAPDAYGHTHFIKVYDRNAPQGQQDTFIGQLKESRMPNGYPAAGEPFSRPANTPPQPSSYTPINNDSIPF